MFCLFRPSCLSTLPSFLLFLFNVHWSFVCMKGVRYTGPEAADSCGSCCVDAGNWSQVSGRAASESATSSAPLRLFWKGTSTFKNSLDLSAKEWFLLATHKTHTYTHKTPRRMTKKWNLQHKLATTCSRDFVFSQALSNMETTELSPGLPRTFLQPSFLLSIVEKASHLVSWECLGLRLERYGAPCLIPILKKYICMYFDKVFLFLINGAKVC